MSLALEINDAGLILAADGEILAESPGFALLDGRVPVTGEAAVRRARLAPLYVDNRYWLELGTGPLARPSAAARSPAELAHAQLLELLGPHQERVRELLVAVPEWYTREQLALLLGIVAECGCTVAGLVDAGLAAAALEPAPDQLVHLELGLHGAVLTALEHGGSELRRLRFEMLPGLGWLALQQAWLARIADAFVRRTRFDPLHEASSEQRLADALPALLAELAQTGSGRIELPAGAQLQAIEIDAAELVAAVERIYEEYQRCVARARVPGATLHLRLSHRIAALPGLEAQLANLRDCESRRVPRGAAALGALAHERALRRAPGALALVQRLPVARLPAAPDEAPAPRVARVPAQERPTHLLHDSRIHALGGRPLTLGSEVPAARRALRVPAGPGISRAHCTLLADAEGVWLEDHSTFGTQVNGERAGGRVELRVGDRLRLGQPGVEFLLVRAEDDDGAA
jgi:hypothetical protein